MKHYRAIAEYYDAEYESNEMLQRDVPFLLQHLPKRRLGVLEVGTGTARAAIPLAQAGHRVVGMDCDKVMLELARRKRDAVGLGERELELRHGDALKLNLDRQFDAACILFNTFLIFTTLEQQDKLLAGIARHLKPGGQLWIDIFNPDLSLLAEPVMTDLDPGMFFVQSLDRTVQRTVDVERLAGPQLQRVTFNYRWFDASGEAWEEQVRFDLTYLFPRELRLLLERHGFSVVHFWGNHEGGDLTNDSPRIICQARLRK